MKKAARTKRAAVVRRLRTLGACDPAIRWVKSCSPDTGFAKAWVSCRVSSWLLWLIDELDLPSDLQDRAFDAWWKAPCGADRPDIVRSAVSFAKISAAFRKVNPRPNRMHATDRRAA